MAWHFGRASAKIITAEQAAAHLDLSEQWLGGILSEKSQYRSWGI
jgi:hypothetical protein